jgi:hypothetical protein
MKVGSSGMGMGAGPVWEQTVGYFPTEYQSGGTYYTSNTQ